jgi:branched-chain amino acid transport system permease protein
MAVGAYAAYNFFVRIDGMPLIVALILRRPVRHRSVGILFGLPSLRVAACTWRWPRWRRSSSPTGPSCASSGSPTTRRRARSAANLQVSILGHSQIDTPMEQVPVLPGLPGGVRLLAKNLVRSAIGREWMAIRDMDVAAAVIGIRPMYAKLSAFAVSSFIVGVAGALWGFVHLGAWEPAAFSSTARSSCCSWSSSAAWAPSWAASSAPPSSWCCRSLLNQFLPHWLGCRDLHRAASRTPNS